MTLEAMDRPYTAGRQDLDLEDFRFSITEVTLQEMGPVNCVYCGEEEREREKAEDRRRLGLEI